MTDQGDSRLPYYDPLAGDVGLLDPRPSPVDQEVMAAVTEIAASDAATRAAAIAALTVDDGYTLLGYARRMAIFTLRARDGAVAVRGLSACALVDISRVDPRDVMVALAMLHHALVRADADPTKAFADAASLGLAETAQLINGFAERRPRDLDLRDAWGQIEVETEHGAGLMAWGFHDYAPTLDLTTAIIAIADVLTRDDYMADDPWLAVDLPRYWLSGVDDSRVEAISSAARGAASVSARMRPDVSDTYAQQQMTVFLLEADTARSAAALADIGASVSGPFASLAVAADRLFCLVIARAFVQGIEDHETSESLMRFREPLRRVLDAVLS